MYVCLYVCVYSVILISFALYIEHQSLYLQSSKKTWKTSKYEAHFGFFISKHFVIIIEYFEYKIWANMSVRSTCMDWTSWQILIIFALHIERQSSYWQSRNLLVEFRLRNLQQIFAPVIRKNRLIIIEYFEYKNFLVFSQTKMTRSINSQLCPVIYIISFGILRQSLLIFNINKYIVISVHIFEWYASHA
jgi:hypothetical protein